MASSLWFEFARLPAWTRTPAVTAGHRFGREDIGSSYNGSNRPLRVSMSCTRAFTRNMPTTSRDIDFIRFETSAGGIDLAFVVLLLQLLRILLIERPEIVITTGSLPCCIALLLAKYLWVQRRCGSTASPMFSSYRLPENWPASLWMFGSLNGLEWQRRGPYYWGAVL